MKENSRAENMTCIALPINGDIEAVDYRHLLILPNI